MQFKFVCLNLWYGGKLFDNVVTFLGKEKPDVLALQEVYNAGVPSYPKNYRTMQELPKLLGYEFTDFAPAFMDHRPEGPVAESGNAVFSRFPIIGRKVFFYDKQYDPNYVEQKDSRFVPRNLEHVKIEIDGKELSVFNTQGIWGFDGEDNERRLKMSETIRAQYRDKANIILCGDFNTKEHTKSMTNFEKDLKNVFKGELERSFNMRHKPAGSGFATAVVDMVYVSPNIKVVEHYSIDEDVTDHVPLVCVFDL